MKASLERLAQGYIHLAEFAERGRRDTMIGAASKRQGDAASKRQGDSEFR